MTKIDFYIAPEKPLHGDSNIDGGSHDHWLIACRVVEKAYRKNMQVCILTASAKMTEQLDQLLWSYRPNAFVPHATTESDEAEHAPVLIGHMSESVSAFEKLKCDMLVNLSGQRPEFFSRFLRLAEIVSADAAAKAESRKHYKFYKDRGYPLAVHNL